jgi:hypothetical protein
MIQEGTLLWQYLSPEQKKLASDGKLLIEDRALHPNERLSDYSYLVFPFAKMYEGFLKQLFLNLDIITEKDYRSDHFRIGKALSPNLVHRLRHHSAYGQIEARYGKDLADAIWFTWKSARNLVFHYFPHNYRALTFAEAEELIRTIAATMETSVRRTNVRPTPRTHRI